MDQRVSRPPFHQYMGRLIFLLEVVLPFGVHSKFEFPLSRVLYDPFDCHPKIFDIEAISNRFRQQAASLSQ